MDTVRPPLVLLLLPPLLLLVLLALEVRSSRRELLLLLLLASVWFLEEDEEGRFRRSSIRLLDEDVAAVVEWLMEEAPRPRGTGAEGSFRPSRSVLAEAAAAAASREDDSRVPFSREEDVPLLRLDSLALLSLDDRAGSLLLLRKGVCKRLDSLVSLGDVRLLEEEEVDAR